MSNWHRIALVEGILVLLLGGLIALSLAPYRGNASAFFHLDRDMASYHRPPHGFVVLEVPGYDGMQYEAIARQMPEILSSGSWPLLRVSRPTSYAYQRILLPALAWLLSAGHERLFPYTFLAINIFSLLGAAAILLVTHRKAPLYALALALSPAALIGLHFSLAEPLSLLLLTCFLVRYVPREHVGPIDVLLLSLLGLTREIYLFLILVVLAYSLVRGRWRDSLLCCIPLLMFLGWHAVIYAIFGDIPFLMSTGKHAFPFAAILEILLGEKGFNRFTLSSLAFFFLFVLPAIVVLVRHIVRTRDWSFLPLASLFFFGVLSVMPDHIWGSITSIGRVITPIEPLFLVFALQHGRRSTQIIATNILLIGLISGFALALLPHPFILS
jgi:hypothetical protein